ncbi:MAG: hypothetical protein HY332_20830 [Chloroflexi bacterium]|nr:hypothetical protein [Chloroflexota bacterium]
MKNMAMRDGALGEPLPDLPGDEPSASMEIEARATPERMLRAVRVVIGRVGGVVELVEATDAWATDDSAEPAGGAARPARPGNGYRITTRSTGPEDLGPSLTVYEIAGAGGGTTRVRIVQCGFGDQAAWDVAFADWHGRRHRPMDLPIKWRPPVPGVWPYPSPHPGAAPWPPAAQPGPLDGPTAAGRRVRVPGTGATMTEAGAERAEVVAQAALVRQIERAYAQLVAMRRAATTTPRLPGVLGW